MEAARFVENDDMDQEQAVGCRISISRDLMVEMESFGISVQDVTEAARAADDKAVQMARDYGSLELRASGWTVSLRGFFDEDCFCVEDYDPMLESG